MRLVSGCVESGESRASFAKRIRSARPQRLGRPACPRGRGEVAGVRSGDRGQLGEEPVETRARVNLAAKKRADEGVENGGPFARVGRAHEEVMLFSDGAGRMAF